MNDPARSLSESERLAYLRLIRSENVGPRTFSDLLRRYGSAGAALEALPDLVRRSRLGRPITICSRDDAEAELERAARLGVRFVASCEPDYPAPLRAIDAPPPLIAVRGRIEALSRPAVGIVGSRNASASGLVFADRLAKGLGRAGFVIVSGLARGIDAKAHQSSLETGTVAVLAGGHDRIYPSEHEGLARRIAETGAVISEMPVAWEPRARDFPRRNRLVSGLSLGIVVVEAGRRSGSLITARFAAEQGREVFAVPGSPLDARAEGANDLLRQGATFCTRVEDVVDALAARRDDLTPMPRLEEARGVTPEVEPLWEELDLFEPGEPPPGCAEPRRTVPAPSAEAEGWHAADLSPSSGVLPDGLGRLLGLIGPSPVSFDDLVRISTLSARDLQASLMELELRNLVRRHDGNRVSLVLDPLPTPL